MICVNNASAIRVVFGPCVRNALLSLGQKLFPKTRSLVAITLTEAEPGAYCGALGWLAAGWWEARNASWEDAAMVSAHARLGV